MAYSGNAMYEADKAKYLYSLVNWDPYSVFSPSDYKAMMDFDQGLMILGVILVIISFIIMLVGVKQQSEGRKMEKRNDEEKALEILNRRYAKGEITTEQYKKMKVELGDISVHNNEKSRDKNRKVIGNSNNKTKQISIIVIIIIMAILISTVTYVFFGLNNDNNSQGYLNNYNDWQSDFPSIPTYHSVVLEVTGSADSVSLSYTLDDTSRSLDYATLPWSRTMSFAEEGEWYYVYAQNNGEYGWVEATLTIDGEVVETDTSYSSYGVVSVGKYV
jgi:uncharacterized membrane protein